MRKGLRSVFGMWAAAGLLSSMSVLAQEVYRSGPQGQGFYFRGGIGPEVSDRTDVTEFFGTVSGINVKYDPGFRISAAAGYMCCNYFSAELEAGVLYNSIKSITGSPSTDAALANFPMMVNAVFHFPLEGNFVPYVGFGGGASSSILTIDRATINGPSGSASLNGEDSDVVWVLQGFAGFRYEFNDRMAVGFGYKFLATGEPSWDVFSFNSGAAGQLRFDKARTHSFIAEFTMKF